MAYYLTVESKRDEFIPLEIKHSIYFQIVKTKYDKKCAYTLEEIDNFTTMFDNELELRKALIYEGILPIDLKNRKLSIRILRKGKYEKIKYDFLYQKDLEYLVNPLLVVEEIMKRYYQNDFLFLQKFAGNFSNFYECSTTAPEVLQSATISLREGRRHYLLESVDKNRDLLVTRLVKLLILKHTESFDGTINYKDEINYRNLHSVVAFINNYDKKISEDKMNINDQLQSGVSTSEEIEQLTFGQFLNQQESITSNDNVSQSENLSETIQVTTKTRRRKKIEHLDGQLSFTI